MVARANSNAIYPSEIAPSNDATRLIRRLIQPELVANWGLDAQGQVVCLWENPSRQRGR